MNKGLTAALILIACIMLAHGKEKDADNIHITCAEQTYRFKSDRKGGVLGAKITEKTTYSTWKSDDYAIAYTSYNNDYLKIDKATAPGAKPQYRQDIGTDVFYDDTRLCIMKVPVKKDKDVTAEFVCTHTDPAQICVISFGRIYDIDSCNLTLEVPADIAERLVFTPINFPDNAVCNVATSKDGMRTYTYALRDIRKVYDEPMSPDYLSYKPHILVTGYFKNVDDVYRYLKSYVDEEPTSPEVVDLAAELTAGCKSDIERINAVAAWVRNNIRYVAIEHGEYGRRPDTAAKVLEQRYGDCKGSANLIKGMLRSLGMDGRLAWVGTKDKCPYRWEDFPTLAAGNHMIAVCMLQDSIVFIDGTVDYAPAGTIPYMIQGQSAIIEDGEACILSDVPTCPDRRPGIVTCTDYMLDGNNIRGTYTATFTDNLARKFDRMYHSTPHDRRNALLQRFVAAGNTSMRVNDAEYSRPEETAREATLTAGINIPGAVKDAGDKQFLKLNLNGYNDYNTYDAAKRRNDIYMASTTGRFGTVSIETGCCADNIVLPDDFYIDNGLLSCRVTYRQEGTKVIIESELTTTPGTISQTRTDEWNDAVRKINKALSPVLKFIKKQ